ncbi:MAG: hypothetical protein MJ055_01620 [Phascolarctobacterium sp.]|nr:hypothetical protein [Phascolarctobacterium sp.]
MKVFHKDEERENAILENLKKSRIAEAMIFPHDRKRYQDFLSNYQGVRLSKASIEALAKK